MKQLDIFGNEIEVIEELMSRASHKTKTMQEMYGEKEGKTCKTCKYCERWGYNKNFYKCDLWMRYFRGMSAASDIRLKDRACGKYEKRG